MHSLRSTALGLGGIACLTAAMVSIPLAAASNPQPERASEAAAPGFRRGRTAPADFVKPRSDVVFKTLAGEDAVLPDGPYRTQCSDIKLSPGGDRVSAICAGRRVTVDNISACAILSFERGRLICHAIRLPQGRGQVDVEHRPIAVPRGLEARNLSRDEELRLACVHGIASHLAAPAP